MGVGGTTFLKYLFTKYNLYEITSMTAVMIQETTGQYRNINRHKQTKIVRTNICNTFTGLKCFEIIAFGENCLLCLQLLVQSSTALKNVLMIDKTNVTLHPNKLLFSPPARQTKMEMENSQLKKLSQYLR